jgi:hypothetical protein
MQLEGTENWRRYVRSACTIGAPVVLLVYFFLIAVSPVLWLFHLHKAQQHLTYFLTKIYNCAHLCIVLILTLLFKKMIRKGTILVKDKTQTLIINEGCQKDFLFVIVQQLSSFRPIVQPSYCSNHNPTQTLQAPAAAIHRRRYLFVGAPPSPPAATLPRSAPQPQPAPRCAPSPEPHETQVAAPSPSPPPLPAARHGQYSTATPPL